MTSEKSSSASSIYQKPILVLFQIFQAMIQNQSLSLTELGLLGIIKFIWIMGAGVLTGILCGILGSMLTKWCNNDYQNLGKAFTYYFISFSRHEPERWRIGGMMAASGR